MDIMPLNVSQTMIIYRIIPLMATRSYHLLTSPSLYPQRSELLVGAFIPQQKELKRIKMMKYH
jgi:hypothetical protein